MPLPILEPNELAPEKERLAVLPKLEILLLAKLFALLYDRLAKLPTLLPTFEAKERAPENVLEANEPMAPAIAPKNSESASLKSSSSRIDSNKATQRSASSDFCFWFEFSRWIILRRDWRDEDRAASLERNTQEKRKTTTNKEQKVLVMFFRVTMSKPV